MEERVQRYISTACYLKKDDKILMIKFNKKWGQVYAPPGGKIELGETPLECILREYYEETGLKLKNVKLQGISCWKDSKEGIIFIYVAYDFEGELKESEEGRLEWIPFDSLPSINKFDQNKKFTSCLFKDKIFEGKFLLDDKCIVLDYDVKSI